MTSSKAWLTLAEAADRFETDEAFIRSIQEEDIPLRGRLCPDIRDDDERVVEREGISKEYLLNADFEIDENKIRAKRYATAKPDYDFSLYVDVVVHGAALDRMLGHRRRRGRPAKYDWDEIGRRVSADAVVRSGTDAARFRRVIDSLKTDGLPAPDLAQMRKTLGGLAKEK